MVEPTVITFVDAYAPEERSLEETVGALARGGSVAVRWPARTTELLERKARGRATILDDLLERGGGASGVESFDRFLDEARRYAAAGNGLSGLGKAIDAVGATSREAAFALGTYVRFANLHILAALARTELEGENLGLEDELREDATNKLYNSPAGQAALGTKDRLFAIDVEPEAPEKGYYVFAPEHLVVGLGVGHKVRGELLTQWTIPECEVLFLGKDIERDYRDLTIWHVRDHEFEEI
jgi:hypothetical protein